MVAQLTACNSRLGSVTYPPGLPARPELESLLNDFVVSHRGCDFSRLGGLPGIGARLGCLGPLSLDRVSRDQTPPSEKSSTFSFEEEAAVFAYFHGSNGKRYSVRVTSHAQGSWCLEAIWVIR